MTADPIVSVVIPAYNASRWLGETLASAQAQSLREIEIIVVDDGSKDDTAAIAEIASHSDPRIRVIRSENGGVGAARNIGILAARGSFIAPLDADDLWHPTKLEKQVARFEELGERAGMVYCWYHRIDTHGDVLGSAYPYSLEGAAGKALIFYNFIGNASVPLFRAAALKSIGLYLTREEQGGIQGCEDWDLSIRVAEKWATGLVRESLVGYRQTEFAMSASTVGMSRSYGIAMQRARRRNPNIESYLLRWSRGHFFRYLTSKAYRGCDYPSCLRAALTALKADPAQAMNLSLFKLALKSGLWILIGGRKTPPQRGKLPKVAVALTDSIQQDRTWVGRLQARRLEQVFSPLKELNKQV